MQHLSDITFVISFYRDSPEREENLDYIVSFLTKNFYSCNIMVYDYTTVPSFLIEGVWYRTKAINYGIRDCKTKYVANYDTDVIFPIEHLVKAYELLSDGHTLVYPYSGKFVDIERSVLKDGLIKEKESYVSESYGGAVFMNKEKYRECGWENENIKGWGFEDFERVARVRGLEHSIARVEGACWHIQHPVNKHSSTENPFWALNEKEYYRIKKMSKGELKNEIKKWAWV